jgi:hypothetical protein
MLEREIALVEQLLHNPHCRCETCISWERIKKFLVEGQKPSTNSGSPKLPLEIVEAGKRLHIVDAVGKLSNREYASGAVAMYELLERQLRAGA